VSAERNIAAYIFHLFQNKNRVAFCGCVLRFAVLEKIKLKLLFRRNALATQDKRSSELSTLGMVAQRLNNLCSLKQNGLG